jgi:hypothetical protein
MIPMRSVPSTIGTHHRAGSPGPPPGMDRTSANARPGTDASTGAGGGVSTSASG